MPRRGNIAKRDVLADPMYGSKLVTRLINNIMLDGKKGVAQKIVYDAFEIVKTKTDRDPLEGFEQAMERMLSYNKSLRSFFRSNGNRLPSMNMEAVNSTDFVTSATIENVLEMLNGKWMGGKLTRDDVETIYYREDGEFHPINETEMNHRGTYALGLRFHTQVYENYDSITTRFNLEPYVETDTRTLYEQFVPVVTSRQFNINHPWKNGQERQLTKDDVLKMLADAGLILSVILT